MATKNEVLQVRLSVRTKFAVELVAQQEGKKITKVIEDAIEARAHALQLGVPFDEVFDEDEGVRTLRLLALPAYRPTEEEREIKAFVAHHREFFYTDSKIPHRTFVSILWPKLQHYMSAWREQRHTNHWIA